MMDFLKNNFLYIILFIILIPIVGFTNNFFSLRDRYFKWKKGRSVKLPYFVSLNYASKTNPPKASIHLEITNVSGETRFVKGSTYYFREDSMPEKVTPGLTVAVPNRWPRRLENGERYLINDDLSGIIYHHIYDYWRKDFVIYATITDTLENVANSNTISFDTIAKQIRQPSEEAKDLAKKLSEKYAASTRKFLASLWQIELYDRLTSHILKQIITDTKRFNFAWRLVNQYGLTRHENFYDEVNKLQIKPRDIFRIIEEELL